jgi:hypothetical protein
LDDEDVLAPDVLVELDRDLPVGEFLELRITQWYLHIFAYLPGEGEIGIPAYDFYLLIHCR